MQQNKRYLIVGQSGCGKTWLAQYIADQYYRQYRANIISFSSQKEDLARQGNFSYLPRMKIMTVKEKQLKRGFSIKKAILDQHYLHINLELGQEEIENKLENVHRALFSLDDLTVVIIDEAHTVFSKHHSPNGLKRCLTQGRSEGIVPIVVLQDITGCAKPAVGQTNNLYAFRITDTNDLKRLQKRFGQQVSDSLPQLDKFRALHYDHDTGELEKINTKN